MRRKSKDIVITLTQEELKKQIRYEPETGHFYRLPFTDGSGSSARRNGRVAGERAGSVSKLGYLSISLKTNIYYASKLAYLYMTGEYPLCEVRFKDRDTLNLAFDNLYLATDIKKFDDMTWEDISAIFRYDPETGYIWWTDHYTVQAERVNERAGNTHSSGRMYVNVGKRRILAHRMAWFLYYKEWPKDQIDHINHDQMDNRILNLRAATLSQNQQNHIRAKCNNATQLLGVSYKVGKGKYTAQITLEGKTYHLGTFEDKYTAHQAYLTAKRKLHEFNTL